MPRPLSRATRRVAPTSHVMFVIYNILLLLASPVIVMILLAKKRCRPGLRQRLGWLPEGPAAEWGDGRTIWVHEIGRAHV